MEDIKILEWLEIFLWYKCNYKCNFCFENKFRGLEKWYSDKDIYFLIHEWYKNWKKFILFSWWEPTLDINLVKYIRFSREIGYMKILIHTNWTKTSNFYYLKELFDNGLTWIILSFHWFWEISNLITKNKRSFFYLNKSLINASKIKTIDNSFTIDTNTVINKYNYKNLLILFKYFSKFPIIRRMITFPYSMFNFDSLELKKIFPNIKESVKEINKVLDYCLKYEINDTVVEALPYCLFEKRYWKFIEKNFRSSKKVCIPEDNNLEVLKNYHDIDLQHYTWWKIKFKSCRKCVKYNICLWISEDYLKVNKNFRVRPIL